MDDAFQAVVGRLSAADRILLTTHARPDGDGLGSMVALASSARAAGKTAHMVVSGAVPARYTFLFGDGMPAQVPAFNELADKSDLIVVLDTCAPAQLDELAKPIAARAEQVIVIDHHATSDRMGSARWLDPTAAAVGVMVGEILESLGWPVGIRQIEALLTATMSDTGWLRFANTDRRCLRAVAGWLEKGVRPDGLYRRLHQTARPQRMQLMARMLSSLKLHHKGALAVMTLRRGDFQATGARPEETENLVNEALRIGTVETAVLLIENDGFVRVNLRSREAIDVSAVAGRFGGGGHRRAAGLRVDEDIDALAEKLVSACCEALAASGL